MQVLRIGGHYLQGREQRLWVALVGSLLLIPAGSGVAILVLGLHLVPAGYAVAAIALIGMSACTKVARRLAAVRKGRLGETHVTGLLENLSDDYWLVNDVMLPGGRGNADHVLIGPCGVVVLETKRLAGYIRCYGDTWYVNRFRRGSISRQVNSAAVTVRQFLAGRHADLASTALRFVESVVVFTHPLCRLDLNRPRTIVVRYSELLQLIRDLSERRRLAPAVAARLAESLVASQGSA